MKQDKVSRKELLGMQIGQTRIFTLSEPSKLQSVATTCTQLKNIGKGEWSIRRDYKAVAISVTRNK